MSKNTFLKTIHFKEIGFLLFIYSIIYFWYTYPTITCFSTAVIGKNDPFQVIWNMYIFETGLHAGKLWTTQQSFYPWNTSLIFHEYTPFLDVLSLIIHNKILLLNIVIYGMFISSAVGAFYLSKQFISNRYFAFICGFIFAFSPYKMSRIEEHYPLIQTVIIPCFFLVFIKTFSFESFNIFPRIKSYKNIVLLICLGLFSITLDYLVTFQMACISTIYFMFFYGHKLYSSNKRYFWIYLATFFVLMHVLIAWLLHIGTDDKGAFWWSGKWSDYIIPYNSIVYSGLTTKLWNYFEIQSRSIESVMFIGYSFILILILTFIILLKKRIFDLKIQALIFCFLMLFLMVMPVFKLPFSFVFYPPTAILHFLPIIKNLRCPTRFINIIMLVAPIIVFYVLEQLYFNSKYKIAFATLFFILLFIEYFPKPYAHIDYKSIPKVYYVLKDKPNESVLVYPLGLRDGMKLEGKFDIETMQYQTVYRKKTMGGYISRLEDWMWYVHYQNAFTNSLLQLEKDSLYSIPNADYISALKMLKLDYVVIPQKYKDEKAAIFLQSTVKSHIIKSELINGDLLLSLSR